MAPYKRSDWNGLVDEVNDVLSNPPANTDCEPVATIEHVGPQHRWAKSDIREMQDAIMETCPSITFDEINDLWRQSTIDEIREKLGQAWCDCEEEDDCETDLANEHMSEFILYTGPPPRVLSPCYGDPGAGPYVSACSLYDGMQVGRSGIYDRVCRVFLRVFWNDGTTTIHPTNSVGHVSCEGIAECMVDQNLYSGPYGPWVSCGACFSAQICIDALADAELTLANNPSQYGNYYYYLRIDTLSAFCWECE